MESGGSSGPVDERLLAKYLHDPRHLIDLVQRRIPSPDRVIGEWAREYLKAERTSPPVLSMTPVELSLIVHSPDPSGRYAEAASKFVSYANEYGEISGRPCFSLDGRKPVASEVRIQHESMEFASNTDRRKD